MFFSFSSSLQNKNPAIPDHRRVTTTTFAAFSDPGVQNVASPGTVGVLPGGGEKQQGRPGRYGSGRTRAETSLCFYAAFRVL